MASYIPPPPPIQSNNHVQGLKPDFCQPLSRDYDRLRYQNLENAVRTGDARLVLSILSKASAQQLNTYSTSAMECAIESDQPEIALLLLANGVPATAHSLQAASARGNIQLVDHMSILLSWPIDQVFDDGYTLLTCAVRHEHLVTWLLSRGADVNVEDAWAETPLSRAIESGSSRVIDIFLQAGADVTKGAPLQMALVEDDGVRSEELVRRFLALGAPVDKFIGEGSQLWEEIGFERGTALHYACKKSKVKVVQLLLAYGADPNRNQRAQSLEIPGSSPLDIAREKGNQVIVSMLEGYVVDHNRYGKSYL